MNLHSTFDQPKVSIITPFYNASPFIKEAIKSVLQQTYVNWELLLINDGSSDDSKSIVGEFCDKRIRYFEQENKGTAAARNVGLSVMNGDYFCFFDADDLLPPESLRSRVAKFSSNDTLDFVDGQVLVMDSSLKTVQRTWLPDFGGNPLLDLVRLTGKSFVGATWMVKRKQGVGYSMQVSLSHSEDLLFFMELAREGGIYGYTNEVTLIYRNTPLSAMKNIKGLEAGYRAVFDAIKNWKELDKAVLNCYRIRTKRIMFLSYLRIGSLRKAVGIVMSWL
jgi:teichuronic acid biosynthesis glycosyltransferase TuaG